MREDTHELCYNAACLLLGREQYSEALEKLQQAEGLWVIRLFHLPHSSMSHAFYV